ncbi:MAG: cohesin domain-containing protein [Candidatus Roizmanbacteria bacterium]|nr:cohesin domain-containing protein [Candidatus Roizmanbacteria bacterium]
MKNPYNNQINPVNPASTPKDSGTFLSEHRRSMLIVIGVVLIVILGGIVLVSVIRNRPPQSSSPIARIPTPVKEPRGEMWFDPTTNTADAGDQITVQIMIDAHNTEINGSDAIVNFDPAFLEVVSVEEPNEPDREFILFSRQSEGQLQITTVKSNATSTTTPQMTVALVTFAALKPGTTMLDFEYRPGSTVGSTIVRARDTENILDKVTGSTIVIK